MIDPLGLVGTTLAGKYRIERLVGEGGFGVVYAARQTMLGQPVAVKVIKPGAPGATAFTAAAFLREAKVLFGLSHPGIVRMYDVGETPVAPAGVAPYVVLELLDGVSLDEEIRRRRHRQAPPWSHAELSAMFEPVLDALAFAHARGIVHRDIKPSNIMVLRAPDGTPTAKILDFGMAAGAPDMATTTGAGLTPLYAAPEQWNAQYGSVGPATDVFAMGLCLEEAITLARGIDGNSLPEIVQAATNPARTVRVAAMRPDLATLEPVVVQATRVWPPQRFASAQTMLDAFRASAQAAPPMTAAPASPYAASVPMAPLPPPPPRSTSMAWIAIPIVAVVLLLLIGGAGVVAYFVTRSAPDAPPSADAASTTETATATATTSAPAPAPKPTPTATKHAPSPPGPGPSPSPPPPSPPNGPVVFVAEPTAERGGVDPDFPKFRAVIAQYGPGLEICFRDQRADTLEWNALAIATFYKDGGRGARVMVRKNGMAETSEIGVRIKECVENRVALWPWPKAPHIDDMDGGPAYVKIALRFEHGGVKE